MSTNQTAASYSWLFNARLFVIQQGITLTWDIIAILVVYFVQGALGLARLATTFFLKDELHLAPAGRVRSAIEIWRLYRNIVFGRLISNGAVALNPSSGYNHDIDHNQPQLPLRPCETTQRRPVWPRFYPTFFRGGRTLRPVHVAVGSKATLWIPFGRRADFWVSKVLFKPWYSCILHHSCTLLHHTPCCPISLGDRD